MNLEHVSGQHGRQESEYLIITEGADDAQFLNELLVGLGATPPQVGICYAGSHSQIAPFLKTISKGSAFTNRAIKRIAIVRDADASPQVALTECQAYLSIVGVTANTAGTVVQQNNLHAGFYLFPDCIQSGCLESLLIQAPTNAAQMAASQQFIATAAQAPANLDKIQKRVCQSYLASSSSPLCTGVGRGARNGAFDLGHNALNGVKAFLRQFIS